MTVSVHSVQRQSFWYYNLCFQIDDPFQVVGMASGHLHILDVTGNEVRKYRQHRSPILCVSADEAGEHVASGGQDGTIIQLAVVHKGLV